MRIEWVNKTLSLFAIKIKRVLFWKEEIINTLFKKKNITDTMGETNQENQQKQGFPCPECKTVTPITMEMLIYNQPIFCSGCGIKFMISSPESHKVIEDLKKVHKAQQELKNLKGIKTN